MPAKVLLGACIRARTAHLRAAAVVVCGKPVAPCPRLALVVAGSGLVEPQDATEPTQKLATVGCGPFKASPHQFAARVRSDLPQRARTVRDGGATID